MSDLQAVADRVQIEALRGKATDAVTRRDSDRVASLLTPRRQAVMEEEVT